jgi:hypothetical protein
VRFGAPFSACDHVSDADRREGEAGGPHRRRLCGQGQFDAGGESHRNRDCTQREDREKLAPEGSLGASKRGERHGERDQRHCQDREASRRRRQDTSCKKSRCREEPLHHDATEGGAPLLAPRAGTAMAQHHEQRLVRKEQEDRACRQQERAHARGSERERGEQREAELAVGAVLPREKTSHMRRPHPR